MTKVNRKIEANLLIHYCEKYLEDYEHDYSKFDELKFSVHQAPVEGLLIQKTGSKELVTSSYCNSLISKGLLKRQPEGIYVSLTKEGFEKGIALKHPIKNFMKINWKWCAAFVISLVNLAASIIWRFFS